MSEPDTPKEQVPERPSSSQPTPAPTSAARQHLWACLAILGALATSAFVLLYGLSGDRDELGSLLYPFDTALYRFNSELDRLDSGLLEAASLPLTHLFSLQSERTETLDAALSTMERFRENYGGGTPQLPIALAVLRLELGPWDSSVDRCLGLLESDESTSARAVLRAAYTGDSNPGPTVEGHFRNLVGYDHWLVDRVLYKLAGASGNDEAAQSVANRIRSRAQPSVTFTIFVEWLILCGAIVGSLIAVLVLWRRLHALTIPIMPRWPLSSGFGVAFLSLSFYLWYPHVLAWTAPGLFWNLQSPVYYLYCLWGGLAAFLLMCFLRDSLRPGLRETFGIVGRPISVLCFACIGAVGLELLLVLIATPLQPPIGSDWGAISEPLMWGGFSIRVTVLLNSVLFAPLFEELIFRGMLYTTLRGRYSIILSACISSLIFTSIHGYGWYGSITVFFGGLLSAFVYEYSRSLIPAIAGHAIWNALGCAANLTI